MKGLFTSLVVFTLPLIIYAAELSDLQFGVIDLGEPHGTRYGVISCNLEASGELTLPTVHMGNAVTWIKNNAFEDCINLTSITLPEGIEGIGLLALRGCTQLQEITLPSSLLPIRYGAFKDCHALRQVTLPSNLLVDEEHEWQYEYVFANCTNLSHVVLPALKIIPAGFFENCSTLSNIELPAELERISYEAFSGSAIASVDFPVSLRRIEANAFRDTPLQTIDLPPGLEYIGPDAFTGTELGYQPLAPNLQVIHSFLFAGSDISEYTFPASVERIDQGAFKACKKLTTCDFSLATNLTRIGEQAFFGCSALEVADLTPCTSLTSIDKEAFAECSMLKSISFPDSLTSIGNGFLRSRFLNNESSLIQTVHLPAGITEIPDEAFSGCVLLEHFSSDTPITHIGNSAFNGCIKLKHISLDQANYIGEYAFKSCWELGNVLFSSNLTSIGKSAFHSCKKMTDVHLPNGLEVIERFAFCNCSSLHSLTLPDDLKIIRYAAFWGSKIEELNIPDTIHYIESLAFADNPNLKHLILPENIASVHEVCFRGCTDLQSVQFPSTLTRLNRGSFGACIGLQSTFFLGSAPILDSYVFENVPNVTHYVFAEHYQSFIDGGFSNVEIVNRPLKIYEEEELSNQPGTRITDHPKSLTMNFSTSPEWRIVIECTSSLIEPNWQPIAIEPQIDLTKNRETYLLPTENASHCFYRAVAIPLFISTEN